MVQKITMTSFGLWLDEMDINDLLTIRDVLNRKILAVNKL